MQLSASVNPFGVERVLKTTVDKFGNEISTEDVTAGTKWIIQPKMETPMSNFGNVGIRPLVSGSDPADLLIPQYAANSTPRGMWHQFGVLEPDPALGIFLEIGDIPTDWLNNHYDVRNNNSIYNKQNVDYGRQMSKMMQSLTDLAGFSTSNTSVRLGQLAETQTIKEAIVAVPYQIGVDAGVAGGLSSTAVSSAKNFFEVDSAMIEASLPAAIGSAAGDSLEAAGLSVRQLVEVMQKYVLPPQFDFINNPSIDPMVMYFFEFEYKLDRDDLNYIWQNLAPRNYKTITKTAKSTAHSLADNELMTTEDVTNPLTRWMVFKVKQRSQKQYSEMITTQAGQAANLAETLGASTQLVSAVSDLSTDTYPIEYNWPYDYVSFVESVKFDAQVLYKTPAEEEAAASWTATDIERPNSTPSGLASSITKNTGVSLSSIEKEASGTGVSAKLFNAATDTQKSNSTLMGVLESAESTSDKSTATAAQTKTLSSDDEETTKKTGYLK